MAVASLSDSLRVAVSAAGIGGDLAESRQENVVGTITLSQNSSPTTSVDEDVEELITTYLIEHSSVSTVVGEETGGDDSGTYWLIDPVDGTSSYVRGLPFYCTSIALIRDREPVIGVVYVPETDNTFTAVKNNGAFLNDEPITTSDTTNPDSVIGVSTGRHTRHGHEVLTELSRRVQVVHSAVYAQAMVAAGWYDVGVLNAMQPWDTAAGTILIREAGGDIEHVESSSRSWHDLNNGGAVMWNGKDSLKDAVNTALQGYEHVLPSG